MRLANGRSSLSLVVVVLLLAAGCGDIRTGTSAADPDAGTSADGAPIVTPDGGEPDSGGSPLPDASDTDAPATGPETFAAAAARLTALRIPGPLTSQGSTITCSASNVVWRDQGGTMHSWRYDTQKQLDYGFKAPRRTPFASDAFIAADHAGYTALDVYDATQPATLVTSLPYAYNYFADATGVLRLDQNVGGVALNGTKARKWTASNGQTDDVSTVLSTPQPPSSYANGKVVIPGDVNPPYPLYVVDVAAKTTTSVVFDGGLTTYDTLPIASGLVVSYARTGPVPSIRLYRGYDNASRVELADEAKAIPPIFRGSPANEHTFIARIAADGDTVLYASAVGIWGYDVVKGTLTAVQLGTGQLFVPDAMCVMSNPRALAYRLNGDAVGQVWVAPLAKILP